MGWVGGGVKGSMAVRRVVGDDLARPESVENDPLSLAAAAATNPTTRPKTQNPKPQLQPPKTPARTHLVLCREQHTVVVSVPWGVNYRQIPIPIGEFPGAGSLQLNFTLGSSLAFSRLPLMDDTGGAKVLRPFVMVGHVVPVVGFGGLDFWL